jgi:glycosyltransferase involved in cell wall biosynthesis
MIADAVRIRGQRIVDWGRALGRLPHYAFAARRRPTPASPWPVVYLVDGAYWSIKCDGDQIVSHLAAMGWPGVVGRNAAFRINRILHFGAANVFMTLAPQTSFARNKIVVSFFHGRYGDVPETDRQWDFLMSRLDDIDAIVVPNGLMTARCRQAGVPAEKVFTIPIGVDCRVFSPARDGERTAVRRRLDIPEDAFVVGSFQKDGVGWGEGLAPKLIKGPDVLVEALKTLAERRDVFCLLSGPARGYVKNNLERHGIPFRHVLLEDQRQVADLYRALDAYVVTSREEGGPKAIVEALACGVPLVSTRVGVAPDLLEDGETALLADIGDDDCVAAALDSIASDRHLAGTLRRRGPEVAARCDWTRIARACAEVYNRIGGWPSRGGDERPHAMDGRGVSAAGRRESARPYPVNTEVMEDHDPQSQ